MDQRPSWHLLLVLLLLVFPYLSLSLLSPNANQPFLATNFSPISDSQPSYKTLPILQDDSGMYYIDVTWKNASSPTLDIMDTDTTDNDTDTSDEPFTNEGKMVLALYTSTSFVTTCANFLTYDCSSLDCEINNLQKVDQYYLMAGTEIQGYSVDIGVQSSAFSMYGYSVIYAMICGVGYPMNISGYMGMGFALNAFFQVNRNFSIFLSNGNDGLNSTMFIGTDNNQDLIDSSSNFMLTWETTKDWMVTVTSINSQVPGQPGALTAGVVTNGSKALFDINTNAIGMAYDVFNNLTSILNEYGVSCTKSPYQPSCTYDGDISSLPTFYLNLENQTAIEISPQIYFVENVGQKTSYTLMFAAMASGIPGALQVSPKYENAIILGSPFLTYYYVHFSLSEDYKQASVTVYLAQHNATTSSSKLKIILIIVGSIVGLLIVVAAGIYFIKRRRKNQLKNRIQGADEDRPSTTTVTGNRKETREASLKQPLLNPSIDTSQGLIETSTKKKEKDRERVWKNEHMDLDEHDDILACTYKKQKYRGLYESESDALSLNEELGSESRS